MRRFLSTEPGPENLRSSSLLAAGSIEGPFGPSRVRPSNSRCSPVWLNWAHPAARSWLIAALVTHFGARAWSFAYFIPWALRFEKMGDLTEDQRRQAERWIRLSRVRPFIEFISLIAVGIAAAAEAGAGG